MAGGFGQEAGGIYNITIGDTRFSRKAVGSRRII